MSPAPSKPQAARPTGSGADADGGAQAALERHRAALQERFPLPPEALGPLPPARARPARRTRALVLSVLLAACGLLLWQDPAWRSEQVATGPERRATVELADGSVVELDTGTRLTVSRHLRSRRVVLDAGRALFEVRPSAWRPFTVQAGATRVRVVGTAFDVRRQDEEVTVTVLHGRVAVSGQGPGSALLQADEQIRSHAGQLGGPAAVNSANATAWRQGQMVFQRTPLPEVLAEIARYRGQPVRLADAPTLERLEVSGVYRTANAQALLNLLPGFLPVQVVVHADGVAEVRAK
jgi:transmembrane sensor